MSPEQIATNLRAAELNRATIKPIREFIGVDNIELAYKIQSINTEYRLSHGAFITGKKIGLTSFAVQKQLGVDQPDFGILFNDMEILNGQSINAETILQPKVEAEMAFVLGEDLDFDEISVVDIINSIDYILPAIEIVGSRIENWDIKITDTVADNASASHYVLGHNPKTLDEFDIVNCKMKMTNHGQLVSEGSGSACLGSPINSTLWLAKKMLEMDKPLQAGEVIFTGALGPMVNVNVGDHFIADFEGLGSVSVIFD